jgi:hypothetical protein
MIPHGKYEKRKLTVITHIDGKNHIFIYINVVISIVHQYLHNMTIVLSEDLTTSSPSMLTAVQYNILPSSFMFPVYVSTLDDITLSSLQSVLQTSGCGEAEVVIFVVDKYHCILLDGRAAFVVQENV